LALKGRGTMRGGDPTVSREDKLQLVIAEGKQQKIGWRRKSQAGEGSGTSSWWGEKWGVVSKVIGKRR